MNMGESYMTWLRKGVSVFFEYDTPRIVHIRSKRVGVLSRFVQACILTYIVGYVIVYQKGYQKFDKVTSAVTTKLKGRNRNAGARRGFNLTSRRPISGVVFTNFTDDELVGVPLCDGVVVLGVRFLHGILHGAGAPGQVVRRGQDQVQEPH